MSIDTIQSLRIFLTQQLRDVEEDIETISSYISCNPPETTGELLKLRELQRKYREIAASIKNEIAKLGRRENPSNAATRNRTCPIGAISSEEIECYVVEHEKLNTGFVNSGFDRALEGREERAGGTSS
jgi:hypothetical protein